MLCPGHEILPNHLPPNISGKNRFPQAKHPKGEPGRSAQKEAILDALKKTGGNKTEAAAILGISRVTLWKRLKKLDIQVKRTIAG